MAFVRAVARSRNVSAFLLWAAALAAFSACSIPLGPTLGEAVLHVQFPTGSTTSGARFLAADTARYKLTLLPAKGDPIVSELVGSTGVTVKTNPGSATILLDGYDADSHLLTHGETTTVLVSGDNTVSLTLQASRVLEPNKAFSLGPRQVTYLQATNTGSVDNTVFVSGTDVTLWACAADGSFDASLGTTGGLSVVVVPGATQVFRAVEGVTSGMVAAQWQQAGAEQLSITPDIQVENAPTVVNRLDNEMMFVKFRLNPPLHIDSAYLDGIPSYGDGTPLSFMTDNIFIEPWGHGTMPGPHHLTTILTDDSGHYWSVTSFFRLVEVQPVVVATSSTLSAVIQADGSLWVWGGSYGTGPTRVGSETTWRSVSVGAAHFAALKNDMTAWTWGDNTYGQLGQGDMLARTSPTIVGSLWPNSHYGGLVSAGDSTLALEPGSSWVLGWGRDDTHQLAQASTAPIVTPTYVFSSATMSMSAGNGFVLAIHMFTTATDPDSASLWSWGADSTGQLGDGGGGDKSNPIRVLAGTQWREVSAGGDHALGIQQDGSLWSWGANGGGQLGFGSADTSAHTPAQILLGTSTTGNPDNQWSHVAAGTGCSFALRYDGSLWGWGTNLSAVPTQLGTDLDWKKITAGGTHVMAVKTDGSVWWWNAGQTAPTQVLP